jgi:hypothetical protein
MRVISGAVRAVLTKLDGKSVKRAPMKAIVKAIDNR